MKTIFPIVMIILPLSIHAQTSGNLPPLLPSQAEAQYAYGVSLAYQGEKEAALLVLGQLIENGYHNPYAFQMALSIGASLLQQREFSLLPPEKLFSMINYLADLGYTNYFTNREVLASYLDVKKTLGQWSDFEQGLHQLLRIDPENVLGNFYRGLLFYNQRKLDQARVFLLKVISNDIDNDNSQQVIYQSYYLLGLIELQKENYREGIAFLEKARKNTDQDYNLDKYLAYGYQQLLMFRKAHDIVKNIPELFYNADHALIRVQTGFVLNEKEWFRLAKAYEKDAPLARAYRLYGEKKYRDVLITIENLLKEYQVEPIRVFYANYLRLKAAEALKDNKTRREMLFLLGVYAHQVGQIHLAIQYLQPLEKEPDLRLDALLTLGSLHEENENYPEAIKKYEQFLIEKPADTPQEKIFDLTLALSFLHNKISNTYRADVYHRQAEQLARTPTQKYRFWLYSGLINQQKNLHQQAIIAFQKAKSFSNTAGINFAMGNSYFFLQKLPEAQTVLEESLSFRASSESYNLLAYVYALQHTSLDKALLYIQKALEEDPDNLAYQDTLGWIYFQMGQYEKALEVFANILLTLNGIKPFDGLDEVYYHIGMVYQALNRPEDARLMWEKGLSLNPNNGYIKERLSSK